VEAKPLTTDEGNAPSQHVSITAWLCFDSLGNGLVPGSTRKVPRNRIFSLPVRQFSGQNQAYAVYASRGEIPLIQSPVEGNKL